MNLISKSNEENKYILFLGYWNTKENELEEVIAKLMNCVTLFLRHKTLK